MSQAGRFGGGTIPPGTYVQTLTGNTGGPVGPDLSGNINTLGTNNITVAGNAGTNTLDFAVSGTTNHSLLLGNAVGALSNLGVANDGELPIGSTGVDPVLATLTAGTGVSIVNGSGSITISSSGGGLSWSVITADQTASVNNGYICNKAGTLALALPGSSSVGDIVRVTNINTSTGTQFTQAAGQQIFFATSSTTLGATGTLTSTQLGDSLEIVCTAVNTTWRVISSIGNWTVV